MAARKAALSVAHSVVPRAAQTAQLWAALRVAHLVDMMAALLAGQTESRKAGQSAATWDD
jgi:hypothetical protein